MRRGLLVIGGVWLVALAACAVVALSAGVDVAARDYFAGWLVAVSLPLGALPILMVQDLIAAPETRTRAILRLLLAALPLVALLVVPALFDLGGIFPWPKGSRLAPTDAEPLKGLAKAWFTPIAFGFRAILYLVGWSVLALFFVRPAPASQRHRTIAGIGLVVHLVIGTLAAFDWWMSLDQAFVSSAYGLVVITGQSSFALAIAALAASMASGAAIERPVITLVLALLGLAVFLQFSNYLVIWSANLPKDIAWYQARSAGALSVTAVIGLPVLLTLIVALLMPAPLSAMRAPTFIALAALVLVAFLDLACLASAHGSFTFAGVGIVLAVLIVLAGFGAICAATLGGRLARRLRHG